MSSLEAFPKPDCYAALNCEVMLISKLTVQEFVTIDGFAAAPDGALDFMPAGGRTPADPQIERDQLRFIKDEVDTMLLGRTTYQIFIDYWPTATADNEIIADELNALSKVVASRTLDHAPWGDRGDEATIVRDGVEAAAALRRQCGKGVVVWDSLTLAQSLMRAGVVDECQLYVCPNVLGAGKPLFAPEAGLQPMRFLEAKHYDSGVILLRYAPEGAVPAAGAAQCLLSVILYGPCRFWGVSFVYQIGG
jgi:dihydrofolate reductase